MDFEKRFGFLNGCLFIREAGDIFHSFNRLDNSMSEKFDSIPEATRAEETYWLLIYVTEMVRTEVDHLGSVPAFMKIDNDQLGPFI